MPLPQGFVLEQPKLPPGFVLEPSEAAQTPPGEIPGTLHRGDKPQPDVPRSFMQRTLGTFAAPLDVALTLASGAVRSSWLNPVIGAVTRQTAEQVAAGTRQPQTPEARALLEAAGPAMQSLIGVAPMTPIGPAGATRPAVRAAGDVIRAEGDLAVAPVQAALQARREATQQANVTKSYANAPVIDATNAAQRQGLAVNPAVTNPTIGNRFKNMTIGPAFDEAAVKHNAKQVTNLVRKDLGVAAEEGLTPAVVDRALDIASKPVTETLNKIARVEINDAALTQLQKLKKPPVIGGEAKAAASDKLVDSAITNLSEGVSGQQVWDSIRSLRHDAQAIYKAQKTLPDPVQIAQADTQMAIANVLENLIDANAPSTKSLSQLRAARQRMAQIFDHERAIDFANETVDPQAYAKMLSERQGRMTGVGADIGKVAATFPSLMSAVEPTAQAGPKIARSGITGAAGALIGGAIGGYPGAIAGATFGGGLGHIGQRGAARTMVTPEYQAARAMPQDYRPPVNMLRPAEVRPYGEPNQLVPYAAQEVLLPGEGPYQPNFVFARPQPEARFVGPRPGPAQLPAPSAETTLNALRAEDARRAAMSRALGQESESRQAATEAAARRPAAREVILEVDPITGRLREASQGIRGATPETFRDFGASLKTASEKVTSGRLFDLTAAEKVAWDKTKVDLAEVAPGFKSLTDKAIAEKMMDRQWVDAAIVKTREKAAAFDQIAQRAKDAQARQTALANRERMMDLLTSLEDQLRAPRPVSLGGQGPKTRAAKRNALAPESESTNALAP